MIAKLHYDTAFDRLTAYITQQTGKRAEVLAVNGVRSSSPEEMAADFELQRSARPRLGKAVEHISLAWPPGETEKLTNEVMVRAAMLYLEKRGIDPTQTQWALVRHYDQAHPHAHLLLNRVTDAGGVIPDKHSHLRSAEACRKVEAEMGFVDAAKLGAAKTLVQAEQAEPQVKEVTDRLRLKALVVQALEKHLPAVTTMAGLQAGLATEGVNLATIMQKEKLQGVVFTAEVYPELHMKGSEVARQYSGGELRKTLEAQAAQRAREEREMQQRAAEQQAQLVEAQQQAQLREVLLAALARQIPGATSVAELLPGLAREGVTARPSWQGDGQLREISFAAAAFPGRELGGAALGPQYEATGLSQTLADSAAQRAAEQRQAGELRQRILDQEQQITVLREAAKQADYRGDYFALVDLTNSQLPAAEAQLTMYREQARATTAGLLELQELAEAANARSDAREHVQQAAQRALRQPLEQERGNWQGWPAYKERVQQLGFDILEIKGEPDQVRHVASGEQFDLTLVQPGGANAPKLQQQVYQEQQEQNEQENVRRRAEVVLAHVLATRQFTSQAELGQQLRVNGYWLLPQPTGQDELRHEVTGRRVTMTELRPNGQPLEAQLQAAMVSRQAQLRRGQLEVGPAADGSAVERAERLQQLLAAAGAQVSAADPAAAGKVVLEYRYEWNGARLEAVNQALRQAQASPGTVVREQRGEFHQPAAEWPVRAGEYGQATIRVGANNKPAAERVVRVIQMLEERGAWVNEKRSVGNHQVELAIGYQTRHPDFAALNEMLDVWDAMATLEVQETPYARLVRGEARQSQPSVLPTPGKAASLPALAQEQQASGDYERD